MCTQHRGSYPGFFPSLTEEVDIVSLVNNGSGLAADFVSGTDSVKVS